MHPSTDVVGAQQLPGPSTGMAAGQAAGSIPPNAAAMFAGAMLPGAGVEAAPGPLTALAMQHSPGVAALAPPPRHSQQQLQEHWRMMEQLQHGTIRPGLATPRRMPAHASPHTPRAAADQTQRPAVPSMRKQLGARASPPVGTGGAPAAANMPTLAPQATYPGTHAAQVPAQPAMLHPQASHPPTVYNTHNVAPLWSPTTAPAVAASHTTPVGAHLQHTPASPLVSPALLLPQQSPIPQQWQPHRAQGGCPLASQQASPQHWPVAPAQHWQQAAPTARTPAHPSMPRMPSDLLLPSMQSHKDRASAGGSSSGGAISGGPMQPDAAGVLSAPQSHSSTPSRAGVPATSPSPAPMPSPPSDAKATFETGDSVALRVHAVTFNMAGVTPHRFPKELFGSDRGAVLGADVFVLAFQEACPQSDLEELLVTHLPTSAFVKVGSRSLMGILLYVFVRSDLSHVVRLMDGATVATGVGNVLGNKGGVALSLDMAGVRLLVVGCHLAAHDGFVDRRNADFARIALGMPLPASSHMPSTGTSPPRMQQQQQTVMSPGSSSGRGDGSDTDGRAFPRRVWASVRAPARPPPGVLASPRPPEPHPHNYHPGSAPSALPLSRHNSERGTEAELPAPLHQHMRDGGAAAGALAEMHRSASSPVLRAQDGRSTDGAALEAHDVVIWSGDLNYRIQGTPASVMGAIQSGLYELLHANEQLGVERASGRTFRGFHELPITFPPTFKHAMGTDEYNPKRTPSWTDRVLFMCNSPRSYCELLPLYYTSVRTMRDSDHKPVVAGFELRVTPSNRMLALPGWP